MNKDNIQELLKPRYKVIADYPNNKMPIDAILIPNRLDGTVNNDWVSPDPNDRKFIYADVSKYPHLFRRLEWWEDRDVKDMPEYVKRIMGTNKGKVYKIADPSQNGRIWHEEREIEYGYFLRYAGLFEPATETQFNDYKKQVHV